MTTKTAAKALTLLRSAELTGDMDTDELKEMAAIAVEVEFPPDEVIYEKGTTGRALYLIQSGEVVIEADVPGQGRVIMNRLGPGQFFGWSSLFPPEQKMGWTRAVKPTQAIAFDAKRLRALWRSDHGLEYAMIRRAGKDMADRIKAARQRLADMLALEPSE